MQTSHKKILFINRSAPYSTARAQEALDALLMASAFNQTVSVLFIDDGVLQLKQSQSPRMIAQKNFTQTFKALSLYDIENVYVEEESLIKRELSQNDLITSVTSLDNNAIGKLIQQQDVIFNF